MSKGVVPMRMRPVTATVVASMSIACSSGGMQDSGRPPDPATDVFVRAADGIPGGPLRGVYVVDQADVQSHTYDQRAYLAGGYVGIDPSRIPTGASPGRLMGYDGTGHFTTLCRTPHALEVVYAERGQVYAAGEGPDVTRYDPSTHACSTVALDTFAAGDTVTLRAMTGSGAFAGSDPVVTPMYIVGVAVTAGVPRALLYRYDASGPRAVTVPDEARGASLASIAYDPHVGYQVVGEHGVVLHRATDAEAWTWLRPDVLGADDALRSVSIDQTELASRRHFAMAVGGDTGALVLAHPIMPEDSPWTLPRMGHASGFPVETLNAVYTRIEWEVYLVGHAGLAVVFNGADYYTPPRRLTDLTLYAVHGADGLVMAVGGEDGAVDPATDSHAVIMVRGDFPPRTTYVVDDAMYTALGTPRLEVGGGAPQ